MPSNNIVTRTEKFLHRNLNKLKQALEKLDAEIKEKTEERNRLNGLIKTFENSINPNTILQQKLNEIRNPPNNGITPISKEGIKLGLQLPQEDFKASDFPAGINGYQFMAAWKNKSWIESLGAGRYRIKECFGGDLREPSHSSSD